MTGYYEVGPCGTVFPFVGCDAGTLEEEIYGWLREGSEVAREVLRRVAPFVGEDDLGTTFASVGMVFLVAAALETESSALLRLLTGYPAEFIQLVLRAMWVQTFREGAPFRDVGQTILIGRADMAEVRGALEAALETFWLDADTADTDQRFTDARAGRLFGGSRQDWWMRRNSKRFCRFHPSVAGVLSVSGGESPP
jgi:hypothetical protein